MTQTSDVRHADIPNGFVRSEELRARNPLFGPNKLKLGVFGLNSIGCALTLAPERFQPGWESSVTAAIAADEFGFEAIVPYARWKSYVVGDVHHRSSQVLECFIWAAAVAARTRRSTIFATCHVPVFHPIVAAKQAATIDQISGGRFGLNVVAGWFDGELSMFGKELRDHEARYALAGEWLEIVQRAWSEPDEFDHLSENFEIRGAYFEPKPAQAPHPVIMNAGGSQRGQDFAARYSDMAFVMFGTADPGEIRQQVDGFRERCEREHGRRPQIWTPAYIIAGDTDDEARARAERVGTEYGDFAAADSFIEGMVGSSSNLPPDVLWTLRTHITRGGGGFPLIGSVDTIVESLEMLADAGVDGLLLSWVDYHGGLAHFGREIMPRLERLGLRQPITNAAAALAAAQTTGGSR